MKELKDKIIVILNAIKSKKFEIDMINKTQAIPMMLLIIKSGNPSIKDMREAMNELYTAKEAISFRNSLIEKMYKDYIKKETGRELTENDLFLLSFVMPM